MPSAVIKFIVSSSESEPGYSAENLLHFVSKRTKWKGKAGAAQNVVVLQLDREYTFTTIDVGNEYSALIEILVSRSAEKDGQFYTIVPSTSFMDQAESRSEKNGNRVRIFSDLDMIPAIVRQKWDVVKVVCSQPFNRNIPYGLSFVNFAVGDEFNSTNQKKSSLPKIMFKLKEPQDDPDSSMAAGTIFQRWTSVSPLFSSTTKNEQNVSITSSLVSPEVAEAALSEKVDKAVANKPITTSDRKFVGEKGIKKDKKTSPSPNVTSVASTSSPLPTASNRSSILKGEEEKKPTVMFEKLLDGVTICMSGYENPLRGVLREKALEMGASYSPDWTAGCTHLICAFPNTPKWRQVKNKSRIVTGKWIEKCYALKKRLPEQKFLCR